MLERKERHELIIFDFPAIIGVYLRNQPLNVNSHLELSLDDVNQTLRIYVAATVRIAAQSHIGIQRILFIRLVLEMALFADNSHELVDGDLGGVIGTGLGHHPLELGLCH